MNLLKKSKDFTLDGEEYVMFFDMKSIFAYQEIGKTFNSSYQKIARFDDQEILDFIACTLRRKSEPDKPLGKKVIEEDAIFFLVTLAGVVIELVAASLPENKGSKK